MVDSFLGIAGPVCLRQETLRRNTIQPLFVPPNMRFEINDILQEWIYSENFDFIHGRMLFSWFDKIVILRAHEFLNRDEWLELQDAVLPLRSDDGNLEGTDLDHWMKLLIRKAAEERNNWTCASQYMKYMREECRLIATGREKNSPFIVYFRRRNIGADHQRRPSF